MTKQTPPPVLVSSFDVFRTHPIKSLYIILVTDCEINGGLNVGSGGGRWQLLLLFVGWRILFARWMLLL